MERCSYCTNGAIYSCSCNSLNAKYCKEHQEYHENREGNHEVTLLNNNHRIPNKNAKKSLIEKIEIIKETAKLQMTEIIEKSSEIVAHFNRQVKLSWKRLYQFCKLCDSIVKEIQEIETIEKKMFNSQLEYYLLNPPDRRFLSSIRPPKVVVFPKSKFDIQYHPSLFPHILYNYSNYSCTFSSEKEILVHPSKKNISAAQLNFKSRFLNVGNSQLLITGGCECPTNYTFLLDLNTKVIQEFPRMIFKRRSHSMAWIANYPAIIGGYDGINVINCVEVYRNHE